MEKLPPYPGRILVRGVNWLGDAVMTTPALLRLREKFPEARITLLTPEKLSDLWQGHPAVDETISFSAEDSLMTIAYKLRNPGRFLEFPYQIIRTFAKTSLELRYEIIRALTKASALPKGFEGVDEELQRQDLARAAQVAKQGVIHPYRNPLFDLAVVLPNSPRSALEVFFAGIPRRVGYSRPWRNWFLTQTVAPRAEAVTMRKRSEAEIKKLVAADWSRRPSSASRASPVNHVLTSPAGSAGTDRGGSNIFGTHRFGGALRVETTRGPKANGSAHQIHEYLHLVAALGANLEPLPPQLFVALDEIEAARKKLGLEEMPGPVLGLNPGAEYGPAKRWPVERFLAAALEIQKRTQGVWLLFGGQKDQAITGQIAATLHASGIPHHDLAGRTTLRELMALLKLCRVLLTNDTGPMHVAAALGTPVVVPFGSTSPELTGPGLPGDARHYLLKSDAPCAPCFRRECPIDFRCMKSIEVEQVVAAVRAAIGP